MDARGGPASPVLAGGGSVQATGKAVCACFSVGLETIGAAVLDQRLTRVAEIGAALKAGTNCGSCNPELRDVLKDQLATA